MPGGIPCSMTIPESKLPAYDDMSVKEFDLVMETGFAHAKADDSFDMDEVFEELEDGLGLNGRV